MERQASSKWQGSIKEGKGSLKTQSDALQDFPYSFKSRFKDESGTSGTNPEELIAAAHAGCFNMALSKGLSDAGYEIESLKTEAKVGVMPDGEGFKIGHSKLKLTAKVKEIGKDEFMKIANATKEACPVSKVLNADIILDATLES